MWGVALLSPLFLQCLPSQASLSWHFEIQLPIHSLVRTTITADAGLRYRQELERRSLVRGYEFRKGKYLLLSDDDLDSVKVDSSSVMTIEKFVDTAFLREAIAKTGRAVSPKCNRLMQTAVG